MRYVDVETNEVVWIHKIRAKFPGISIPDNADLEDLGYIKIEETPQPEQEGFYAVEVDPVDYKQTWELRPIIIPLQVPVVEEIIPEKTLSVTARQIRLKLNDMGLLTKVEELIASETDETIKAKLNIEWEYATEFDRNNYFIVTLSPLLDLTEEDVDNIFIDAATL